MPTRYGKMRRFDQVKLAHAISVITVVIALTTHANADTRPPNIVLILADNLGYGELGVYGGGITRGAATPRIDALAREGTRLTNFNVEPSCTPSRSALLTGRHPIRSGTWSVPVDGKPYGLVQWEVTMAEVLSAQGYATGLFGKWHLGDSQGRYPSDQGFDEWWGIPNSSDESFWAQQADFDASVAHLEYVMMGEKGQPSQNLTVYNAMERQEMDGQVIDHTIGFIDAKAKADKPFFAFVPLTQPHMPTEAGKAFVPRPVVHVVEELAALFGGAGRRDGADDVAGFDHPGEQTEPRTAELLAHILDDDRVAQVGLVVAIFEHGFGIGDARERSLRHRPWRPAAKAGILLEYAGQHRFDGSKHIVLRHETHLEIELVEFPR